MTKHNDKLTCSLRSSAQPNAPYMRRHHLTGVDRQRQAKIKKNDHLIIYIFYISFLKNFKNFFIFKTSYFIYIPLLKIFWVRHLSKRRTAHVIGKKGCQNETYSFSFQMNTSKEEKIIRILKI